MDHLTRHPVLSGKYQIYYDSDPRIRKSTLLLSGYFLDRLAAVLSCMLQLCLAKTIDIH
ncbi:Protein of unknown function [Pyronema omphalodes CBS 100304]|uniref:Uncharacterized protein n=1 Tax=Pyronema omphalodes (strain CBS 100304) TaxID=1076935 RepID=U4LH77_PYROM|nr:Protein of unknown function [Pyronema omphalodes CBS 100304]